MTARITFSLTADGELEVWLNEQGRDLLVRELQMLNEKNDHFHFGAAEGSEVKVSYRAYRPDDKIFEYGKVLFRTDAWDRQHYPHVLEGTS
jgi:hypothetical protein